MNTDRYMWGYELISEYDRTRKEDEFLIYVHDVFARQYHHKDVTLTAVEGMCDAYRDLYGKYPVVGSGFTKEDIQDAQWGIIG
jgi:hypothetical protein